MRALPEEGIEIGSLVGVGVVNDDDDDDSSSNVLLGVFGVVLPSIEGVLQEEFFL